MLKKSEFFKQEKAQQFYKTEIQKINDQLRLTKQLPFLKLKSIMKGDALSSFWKKFTPHQNSMKVVGHWEQKEVRKLYQHIFKNPVYGIIYHVQSPDHEKNYRIDPQWLLHDHAYDDSWWTCVDFSWILRLRKNGQAEFGGTLAHRMLPRIIGRT